MLRTHACLRTLSTHGRLWLQTISAVVSHFATITSSSESVAASAFSAMPGGPIFEADVRCALQLGQANNNKRRRTEDQSPLSSDNNNKNQNQTATREVWNYENAPESLFIANDKEDKKKRKSPDFLNLCLNDVDPEQFEAARSIFSEAASQIPSNGYSDTKSRSIPKKAYGDSKSQGFWRREFQD